MQIIYVAGPFRGKTPWDVAQNVRRAEEMGLEVAKRGHMPLIPHANTALFDGQCNDQFWLDGTMALLYRCDGLITLPTWEASTGAKAEVAYALENEIPVYYALDQLPLA
jgi:hypothetical protein